MKFAPLFVAVLFAAGTGPQDAASRPASYHVRAGMATGTLQVTVTFSGEAPASRPVTMPDEWRERNPQDAAACESCAGTPPPDEAILVDPTSKGIENVAISLKNISEGPRAPLPALAIDNHCCRFAPHVGFAPIGAALTIANTDPMSHAAAVTTLGGEPLFTTLVPARDSVKTGEIIAPGIYVLNCPLHAWMRGYVIASKHPYVGTTGRDGVLLMTDVPAGARALTLWHERLGSATATVTVKPGETARLALDSSAFRRK